MAPEDGENRPSAAKPSVCDGRVSGLVAPEFPHSQHDSAKPVVKQKHGTEQPGKQGNPLKRPFGAAGQEDSSGATGSGAQKPIQHSKPSKQETPVRATSGLATTTKAKTTAAPKAQTGSDAEETFLQALRDHIESLGGKLDDQWTAQVCYLALLKPHCSPTNSSGMMQPKMLFASDRYRYTCCGNQI